MNICELRRWKIDFYLGDKKTTEVYVISTNKISAIYSASGQMHKKNRKWDIYVVGKATPYYPDQKVGCGVYIHEMD